MTPKISIIVPAYNEEKHIGRCLDSILNQTFTDFEVICVDDSSTDNTFNIIKEYAEKDQRIIPVKNTEGKGLSSARNYGINHSDSEYIAFVDSDDFIQPQMYEFLYKSIDEFKTDIALCKFIRTENFKPSFFEYESRICDCNEFLNYENENPIIYVSACNKLLKRCLLNNGLRFEGDKHGEDTLFSSHLYSLTNKISFVNLPLYCYYYNAYSITHTDYPSEKWMEKIIMDKKIFDSFCNYNNHYAASFFLSLSFTFLLSYRYEIEKTKNYKSNIKTMNQIGKEYLKYYIRSDKFSLLKKIYIFISFYFPHLYGIYRKIRSNN